MAHGAETPDTLQNADYDHAGTDARWIALIGPNEASRRVMARALASSSPVSVREFDAYPPRISDVPRLLEQNCSLIMIDVDSDESYALAIVQKVVATSSAIVMVYSTRSQPELIMRCMSAGARDFLPIPSDPESANEPQPVVEPAPEPEIAPAVAALPAPVPAAVSTPAPPASQPDMIEAKAATPPPPLPEWEVPVVPVFRPVGAAPPPSEKRRRLKWLLVIVAIVAAGGLAMTYLGPQRQIATHGIALPWSRSDHPAVPSSPAAVGFGSGSTGLPSAASLAAQGVAARPSAGSQRSAGASSAVSVDSGAMNAQLAAPARISGDIKRPAPKDEPTAGFSPTGIENGSGSSLPGAAFGGRSNVRVVPSSPAVSAGVAAGLLIHKTEPVYPKFAREAHVSGTVVLGATITTTGAIENVQVISGPAALTSAALNAVRTWRYRPYQLNGQPVEVQTTISVVFKLEQ